MTQLPASATGWVPVRQPCWAAGTAWEAIGSRNVMSQQMRQHDRRADQAGRHAADLVEHARQQDADEPPGGVGGVVEADILGRLLRSGIGQDQIGVQRGVDGERQAEQRQARRRRRDRAARAPAICMTSASTSGIAASSAGPQPRRRHLAAQAVGAARAPATARSPARRRSRWSRPPGSRRPRRSASRWRRGTPAGRRRTRRRARRTGRCARPPAG